LQNIDAIEVGTERKRQKIVSVTQSILRQHKVIERASDVKAVLEQQDGTKASLKEIRDTFR
jgi:hypothetical protein